jgi:hypothetical protein
MNRRITLTEVAPHEYEVTFNDRHVGEVWLSANDGTWSVDGVREGRVVTGFATCEEAVRYIIE